MTSGWAHRGAFGSGGREAGTWERRSCPPPWKTWGFSCCFWSGRIWAWSAGLQADCCGGPTACLVPLFRFLGRFFGWRASQGFPRGMTGGWGWVITRIWVRFGLRLPGASRQPPSGDFRIVFPLPFRGLTRGATWPPSPFWPPRPQALCCRGGVPSRGRSRAGVSARGLRLHSLVSCPSRSQYTQNFGGPLGHSRHQ